MVKVINKVVYCGKKWGYFVYLHQLLIEKVINIIGTYECKADTKGRIMLPSALKKQLANILSDGFIVKRSVFYQCLELHPMVQWNDVMKQVNTLNRFIKKNNDFIRSYMAGLKQVDVDTTGRLLIPKDLFGFAAFKKQIVLSSSVSMIEIWDKQLYEQSIKQTLQNFGDLAEEVMGDNSREIDGLS